jgi:phage shock protein PspC (stress-responsive transcriptional regulator)
MSQIRIAEKKQRRQLYPVMGFIMIVVLAVIAYAVAPAVMDFARANLRGFTFGSNSRETVRLIFALIIFLTLGGIAAMIVALFAPKKQTNIKDSELIAERNARAEGKKMDRIRQRKINREMKNVKKS